MQARGLFLMVIILVVGVIGFQIWGLPLTQSNPKALNIEAPYLRKQALLDRALNNLSDTTSNNPTSITNAKKMVENYDADPKLTFRAIIAASYLHGNMSMINDAIELVFKHRRMNGGMDNPSGMMSVTDFVRLMHYRWLPDTVVLDNGTRISRMSLSNSHINATIAISDNSFRVLPPIGAFSSWWTNCVEHQSHNSILRALNMTACPALAPYTENHAPDPRFSFYPEPDPRVYPVIVRDPRFPGKPIANGTLTTEDYEQIAWSGVKWLRSIDFVPTATAIDLNKLANGLLNETKYRYSYTTQERFQDISDMDEILIHKGNFVDRAPILSRPFSEFTGGLAEQLDTVGPTMDNIRLTSLFEENKVAGADTFRVLTGESNHTINVAHMRLYATGIEFRLDGSGPRFNRENWGVITFDQSDGEYYPCYVPHATGARGDCSAIPSHGYNWDIMPGMHADGEPAPSPLSYYPFVNVNQTSRKLMTDLDLLSPWGLPLFGPMFLKMYLFSPNLADQGNPWIKVYDTSDRTIVVSLTRPEELPLEKLIASHRLAYTKTFTLLNLGPATVAVQDIVQESCIKLENNLLRCQYSPVDFTYSVNNRPVMHPGEKTEIKVTYNEKGLRFILDNGEILRTS